MARRRKTSPAEDWMELVALLPWWAGVALAIGLYLWLHALATAPLPPVTPGKLVDPTSMMWKALATGLQYILPFLCIVGAIVSAVRRHQRKELAQQVAQNPSAEVLDGMSWREFELLVGEAFRQRGYVVAETGGGGADGGVDLVLTKGAERFLVQCKQWRAYRVPVTVVRELYGVMAAKGAAGGFVITSGRFTEDAVDFAHGRNIELIDGDKLRSMIGSSRQTVGPALHHEQATVRPTPSPSCPTCSGPMVRRESKRGPSAGNAFWGCKRFPSCRGTRPIA